MSPTKPRRPILETEPASPVTGHDPSPASSTGPGWMSVVAQTASYAATGTLPVHSPYTAGNCSANPPL